MNFLEQAASEKKEFGLKDGKHLAQLKSAQVKVTQKGDEYIGLVFNLVDGSKHFHNLFFHSEGAIKMCAPQLKKCLILEKLPIYKSLTDLLADQKNFIAKVETAFNALIDKKFEITAETYFSKKKNEDQQSVRISGFVDVPNLAVQTTALEASAKKSGIDPNDEIPF
jgi:hypothetical protein